MLNDTEIADTIRAIDSHLRKNDTLIALIREVKDTLQEILKARERELIYEERKTQQEIALLHQQLRQYGLPTPSEYENYLAGLRRQLESDEWPLAVPPECLCWQDETKIQRRAASIINITVGQSLKDLKFLDFGCGQGQTVTEAVKKETKLAVGYDPKREWRVESNDKMIFVHTMEQLLPLAPFDVILLHDVLDHSTIDPVEILNQCRTLINPFGKLYVKVHPWCSRHGSHLYDKMNKAFLHVVFDETELERIGGFSYEAMPKITNVLATYQSWFLRTGFEIIAEVPTTCELEDFFKYKSLAHDKMVRHWRDEVDMLKNIQFEFIDYILEPQRLKESVI